ncbi:uncharacterized protein LOC116775502 isoform X3 [Danaus plexippus]|uniref:uncharacterized protein LOC116775502 isoform X2 n=1 Tax=Danaus plexippus TaxID=13037 RepID=UPI002AB2C736|nr:uncharacterized protein LOC116775502 isoform X2 [Danaus plexippus]XP_061380992.1 uncharacterized protein LOC116775502 isoform X3 [Danaus plexippus]
MLRVHKFIDFLLYNIFQENIKINVNYVCNDGDKAKLSLSMRSNEARKVVKFLDGYEFTSRRLKYPLHCWRENGPSDINNADDSQPFSYLQQPSQITLNAPDELQAINRQIQLIKKQRILIEEESKLLIEKKRLEMIQNLGPNDLHKLCMLYQKSNSKTESVTTEIAQEPTKVPEFIGPCKLIFGEMTQIIRSKVDKRYRLAFMKLLRANVRKRLLFALKDEAYMSSKEIFAFYRKFYPKETDENLVQELMDVVLENRSNMQVADTGQKNNKGFPTGVKPHKSRMTDKNDDMIFYEDVNTDFEDGFRLDTGPIHSGLCFKNMQNTNDGVCCDFDVQNANEDYERSYEYKTKDLIKCDNENEDFEDEYVRERKDNCMAAIDQTATETALTDEFDIENDLDDWLEDDKDKDNSAEVVKIE